MPISRPLRASALAAVLALIAVAGAACTVPPARLGDLRTSDGEDSLPADYVPPAPAQTIPDAPYGPGPLQTADVYLPKHPSAAAPVLVYVHGGGWVEGAHDQVPVILFREGARLGSAVVAIDYTLSIAGDPATAFPAASRDVDRAIRWAKTQAATWGNAPRVVVLGASAGGNLALMAGIAPGRFVAPDLPPELRSVSPAVAGMVSFAGPVDTVAMYAIPGWRPKVLEPYLGCSPCTEEQVVAANPLHYLGGTVPPAYLAYGTDDWLIPPEVHGLPTAIALMRARGDDRLNVWDRAIWYELVNDDHDIDQAHLNVRYFEIWLDDVTANRWPVAGG